MVELFVQIALTYCGLPYIWGGQDRFGCDCSGLVVAVLRSMGVFGPKEDMTSRGLAKRWPEIKEPKRGALVFYRNRTGLSINHVGIVLFGGDDPNILEAGGGGSKDKWKPGDRESWAAFWQRQIANNKTVRCLPQSQILARGKRVVSYGWPWGELSKEV